jgi:hypothetical protein
LATGFWLGGTVPVAVPTCGFTGSKCDYTPYIYGGIAVAVMLLALILFGLYQYYQFVSHTFKAAPISNPYRSKQKLLKMLWRIDMLSIAFEETV